MRAVAEGPTPTALYCAGCGHALAPEMSPIERFGERFCSEAHAEEFASGVRAARMRAAAQSGSAPASCAMAAAGQRTWKDYLKRGACWGAPLLLLLAIPLFWSGSAAAATGGSILSVLALLACPLGMFFMMRAMAGMNHGPQDHAKGGGDNRQKESPK